MIFNFCSSMPDGRLLAEFVIEATDGVSLKQVDVPLPGNPAPADVAAALRNLAAKVEVLT